MKKPLLSVALAALAMQFSACIRIGKPFPTNQVRALVIGTTSQADVEKTFGEPFRTGVEDGDTTWTYVNYRLSAFGQQCTQDLVVRFSADNKVKSYTYNTSSGEACPKPQ